VNLLYPSMMALNYECSKCNLAMGCEIVDATTCAGWLVINDHGLDLNDLAHDEAERKTAFGFSQRWATAARANSPSRSAGWLSHQAPSS
jgi:hypothetical protein